jgi:hypothetical protein
VNGRLHVAVLARLRGIEAPDVDVRAIELERDRHDIGLTVWGDGGNARQMLRCAFRR